MLQAGQDHRPALSLGKHEVDDLDDAGTASLALPKNSRHTVRICAGMRCTTQRALVIRPSRTLFCTPAGRRELVGDVLPRPSLNTHAGMSSRSVRSRPCRRPYCQTRSCHLHVVDLAQVVVEARDLQPPALGVTMRQDARLSSAVPQSTAFLPPGVHGDVAADARGLGRGRVHGEHVARALGRGHALRHHAGLAPDRRHQGGPRPAGGPSAPRSSARASRC